MEAAVDRVRRRGQDRVFDVELEPLFMVGHADSLSRAVVNLSDHAVKWTPSGGTVRVRLEGNRLRISDEGPGIPEADLPYVFDRFFRGQTGRATPGTGLGLSMVTKTVEDHGGTVSAGRATSGGAELTVQLPGVTTHEALSGLLHGSVTELHAARSVEAAAAEAAGLAERAVLTAADTASSAALAARRARAAATVKTASAMAETVGSRRSASSSTPTPRRVRSPPRRPGLPPGWPRWCGRATRSRHGGRRCSSPASPPRRRPRSRSRPR